MKTIETGRLILRAWLEEDADPYFQINQDPKVIECLRGSLTMEEVKDFIFAANKHLDKHGFTLWAVELKEIGELIGFIGLYYTTDDPDWCDIPFTPCVDIGWRLGSQYWGKGYATEGAKAALNYGFSQCNLQEVVAFTAEGNVRSIRVMEKLGMRRDESGDFAHPKLPLDHPLSKHVLYRIQK